MAEGMIKSLAIGGKVLELLPLSYGMVREISTELHGQAVREFGALAKEAGLPLELVREKLAELDDPARRKVNMLEQAALTLHARARHAGVTLEQVHAISAEELLLNLEAILDSGVALSEDDQKKMAEINARMMPAAAGPTSNT